MGSLPLVGYLTKTRAADHVAATRDLCVAYFFGFMPIWVTLLLQFLLRGPSHLSDYWGAQIDSGSVFVVSSAMFSSYIYVLMNDEADNRTGPFPHKVTFLLIFVGIIVAWALVMGMQTLSSDPAHHFTLDVNAVRLLTYTCSLIALGCLYLLFTYRNALSPGYAAAARAETTAFTHDWLDRNE